MSMRQLFERIVSLLLPFRTTHSMKTQHTLPTVPKFFSARCCGCSERSDVGSFLCYWLYLPDMATGCGVFLQHICSSSPCVRSPTSFWACSTSLICPSL